MLRRLLLLCALAAFGSEVAYGLGMGELELDSALNQEFDAEIELTNVRGLEPQEILPGLASQDDFDRVGIERGYQLLDLRFDVITNDAGNLAVKITSTRPIVEPYLNFLVEVLWPSGRILREYTVLLDPPVFGEQGIQRIDAPTRQQQTGQQQSRQQTREQAAPAPAPARREQAARTEPAPERRLDQGSRSGDEYGMTGPGDTLWAIALDTRPNDSISVQQMMLALKRANPDAFINDNINLLKAGHVLRIPDAREIREESFESAVAKVRAENNAFQSYRGGQSSAQLDASPRRPGSTGGSRPASEDGELRLLASDGGTGGERAGQGGGNSARVGELENELSVAEEDLDRARRANAELNSRLTDLEDQLETLNEIVKLKDDQLAALRAEVQRLQSEPAAAPPAAPQRAPASGSLLTNPLVLGGLALLVVIAAAGGMIYMRRKNQTTDDFAEEEFTAIASEAEAPIEEEEAPVEAAEVALEEEEEDVSPQTSDVISEAEIYIAYGRFPQAITFLQNAMESEPDRADIQLKLLEVYVQTEDATAFNLQLERLKALGDDEATAQALEMQQQIPGAAEEAAASMDATVVSSEPIAAIDEPADDDDDLSFDLDDLDAETEDDSLDLSDDVELDDDAEELDIDLELDDEDDTSTAAGDDTDLDLDLDLTADSTEGDDEIELDLDDDADESTGSASVDDTLELGDDDLDLDLGEDDDSDGEISLDLDDDDDAFDLDLGDDDDDSIELDLGDDDDEITLDLGDDDDNGDDDAIELDLGDDDDADLESELEQASSSADDALSLDDDDDDSFELNLDDDDDDLDLGLDDDSEIKLDLGDDDDSIDLDLGDDDEIDLDLGDDDELNLDEDASTKLDLARAYIDMGDTDGARNVLNEVVAEGDESEKAQANELLEKI